MKRGQPPLRERELIAAGPAVPRNIAAQRVRHRPSPELDPADDRYRRKWVVPIEAHERPLSHALPTRPWKNASYDGDDGDAFLGADGGGVGRPTGSCGLSEAIRF